MYTVLASFSLDVEILVSLYNNFSLAASYQYTLYLTMSSWLTATRPLPPLMNGLIISSYHAEVKLVMIDGS
jgi:hypothetical protein